MVRCCICEVSTGRKYSLRRIHSTGVSPAAYRCLRISNGNWISGAVVPAAFSAAVCGASGPFCFRKICTRDPRHRWAVCGRDVNRMNNQAIFLLNAYLFFRLRILLLVA